MPRVFHSRLAFSDLRAIGYHIARDNPTAAHSLLDRIERTCEWLAAGPEMQEIVLEVAEKGYRRFTVRNYVIYYRAVPDGIMVARVRHGARDHGPLLEP